jgi:SHS2 domain-containing protein
LIISESLVAPSTAPFEGDAASRKDGCSGREQVSTVIAEACSTIQPRQFTYLDHTADVMIHAWSATLPGAFAQCLLGLYGVMLNIELVRVCSDVAPQTWTAVGHDLKSLLFNFLDEGLYRFHVDGFVASRVVVINWQTPADEATLTEDESTLDTMGQSTTSEAFRIQVMAYGEQYDRERHDSGTEVKAITYSAMNIRKRRLDEASDRIDPERIYEVFVIVDI